MSSITLSKDFVGKHQKIIFWFFFEILQRIHPTIFLAILTVVSTGIPPDVSSGIHFEDSPSIFDELFLRDFYWSAKILQLPVEILDFFSSI